MHTSLFLSDHDQFALFLLLTSPLSRPVLNKRPSPLLPIAGRLTVDQYGLLACHPGVL